MKRWKPWAAPLALAATGLLAVGAWTLPPALAGDEEAQRHATELSKAFREAAERTVPTVVTIEAKANRVNVARRGRPQADRFESPFEGSPFEDMLPEELREFFERGEGGQRFFSFPPRQSMGSGVIIDSSGVILTNNHVVAGAEEVVVHLSDGRTFRSKDIKTDPKTDLAVVRISGAGSLPAAKLGDSDSTQLGDWVIAVGAPFGLDATVSAGIVSNTGRELSDARARTKYLQTDAAINPGNSGGPLVNLQGEVIGINTAIATSNGTYQGVGFAIPVNVAKWVTDELVERGSVQRAYLGVLIQDLTPELAEQFGANSADGAVVSQVYPKTPAAEAGIRAGDVITRFAGKPVTGKSELQSLVERSAANSKQSVEVIRDGRSETLQVTLKPMPDEIENASLERSEEPQAEESPRDDVVDEEVGFEVSQLDAKTAEQLGLDEQAEGVVVTRVEPDSLAAEAGLRPGQLIVKVKEQPIKNLADFRDAMERSKLAKGVLLLVRDREADHFIVLRKTQE